MLVMLDAIGKSKGDRATVTQSIIGLKVKNGILGDFSINKNGDTTLKPITIYTQKNGKLNPLKTLTPPASLTKGA